MESQSKSEDYPSIQRVFRMIIVALAGAVLFLLSPLFVYSIASLIEVDRGIDNQFADFLDAIYEPAQRLTEKWNLYDRYILWCLEATGQQ